MTEYFVITEREARVLKALMPTFEFLPMKKWCEDCEESCEVQGCRTRVHG